MQADRSQHRPVRVVLFSGGRGSQALAEELIRDPRVRLTLAVNGYDDGASTGEVRRWLGDALGPSDFRKNASRVARALGCGPPELIELLDLRLPADHGATEGARSLALLAGDTDPAAASLGDFDQRLARALAALPEDTRARLRDRADHVRRRLDDAERPFAFGDCSLGNLVFAGCYLACARRFNDAVDDYTALLGVPAGVIENVTDGRDAHLVAVDREGRLLASEAEIVDASRRNHVADLHLLERAPSAEEREALRAASPDEVARYLEQRAVELAPNPRLLERIAEADLVIYAPGTQHSSLLPSYLTPGLGDAIAANLTAVKLLVTNLREDAEIPDVSAVEIIEKAVHYLRRKGGRPIPAPCLITHSLVNDPGHPEPGAAYVPLGRLHSLEDPRLVRIADYEEGTSGRHDAVKVIKPFIEALFERGRRPRVAVLLLDSERVAKISQSLLEALRGGLAACPVSVEFFYWSDEPLPDSFRRALPFPVHDVRRPGASRSAALLAAVRDGSFDYALLFESSGMYRGEDIVNVASLLQVERLDSVWGSRRLSVQDIRESYKLRYRKHPLLGAVSYAGSHLLSLVYLLLYGRYVSDTLSGVRAVRARRLTALDVDLDDPLLNQHLLSSLLRDGGEIFETPVRFFSMSPAQVKRTTVADGLRSLATILRWRLRARTAPDERAVGTARRTRPVRR